MCIFKLAAIAASALTLGGCSSAALSGRTTQDASPDAGAADLATPASLPLLPSLRFNEACRAGQKLTLAAVGDVLLHDPLQRQAYAAPNYHQSLWSGVLDLISRADLSYANLEGPAAPGVNEQGADVPDPGMTLDGVVYTGNPPFNYHPTIVASLQKSGFDVVSTANNHAMDRLSLGIDRTISSLRQQGMPFSGTHDVQSPTAPWYTTTTIAGRTIAWLACAYGTNRPANNNSHQVLLCFDDKSLILETVKSLAARPDIDAVVVTPHWGIDWALAPTHVPTAAQEQLGHDLLEAGAIAVLGNHPHVVQPWERYVTSDGRETFLIYCIGNFITGQPAEDERASLILYLGLTFSDAPARRATINGVRYVPTYMRQGSVYTVVPADTAGEGTQAYDLVTSILSPGNVLPSSAPLVTNPECP
jgi:poly-gamma-glutamate synthesis protein (capsule biosynthesis protein)